MPGATDSLRIVEGRDGRAEFTGTSADVASFLRHKLADLKRAEKPSGSDAVH